MACAGRGLSRWTYRDLLSSSAGDWVRVGVESVSVRRPRVTIVGGLDPHRTQIAAEWLDTAMGEVSRTRIAPADRAGAGRFAARFRGQELEVALEATTDWRFVVEELQAVGRRSISPSRPRPQRDVEPRSA